MKHDLNVIHQYWREENLKNPPKPKHEITFDIREDYIEMLLEEGYTCNEDVIEAGEQAILDIDGIGPATVKVIFGG